ncbi:LLM class flavin-dependent oxidoreductase [Nocardia sp. BMG111209]|uniref:LLM class flavin-dependent oxidoreductase n=1 Tax=Nocardia sp. BMG111209 TaxID=1160137 RepID=UPI00035DE03A|nr:LLM class flavin-dependent oxidoreductase [Nocardia sp. BMG111209]
MSGKISFGFLYDFRNPARWQRPWADVYAETLDFITWSESAGFGGAWVPEHHNASDGYMPAPLVMLAAIAARTRSIRLGSAVALAPLYHPVRFAEDCAVLDIISGGRLDMALGIGYRRREAAGYGVEFSARGRRTDEFLDIVTRLWAGETVTHSGKHFTVENAAITPAPDRGHIPLYLGGFSDRALERAARYGRGYFGNLDMVGRYREKLRACGKDPDSGRVRIQGTFVVVAEDPEQAMHELGPYYHHVNNTYGEWHDEDRAATGLADDTVLSPMTLDEFAASGTLTILTPDAAIEMFRGWLTETPVEHFMMMLPPGLPPSRFVKYAETFAGTVIPAFS